MNYFEVNQIFIADLYDDFTMNRKLNIYEFIAGDIIKAYYLGLNLDDWFKILDKDQQYLHSKLIRHNKEGLDKYQPQIIYWINKYPEEDAETTKLLSYLLDNMMFWDRENEQEDKVKLCLFFGLTESEIQKKKEENDKKQCEESSGEH
jgi:hypothetical protein